MRRTTEALNTVSAQHVSMTESDVPDVLEELASLPTLAHPTASPDGDAVAFYYDVTGRNELHVFDLEGRELRRWSDGEVPRNARWFVKWAADGEEVYFLLDEGYFRQCHQ